MLGLSSHHAIHGNNMTDGTIKDLTIDEFEVAGIHLNGPSRVVIQNVAIEKSRTDVPVLGTYSAARFMIQFLNSVIIRQDENMLSETIVLGDDTKTLTDIKNDLQSAIDNFFNWKFDDTVTNRPDAADLFENEQGLPDGSALYGIVIDKNGVAVNGFGESPGSDIITNENVILDNVRVSNLKHFAHEIVHLSKGKPIVGPAGDIFQIHRVASNYESNPHDGDSTYQGNVLSNAQIALSYFAEKINGYVHIGTLHISPEILAWAQNKGTFEDVLRTHKYVCNADSMNHNNKGLIPIRAEFTKKINMTNVSIKNIISTSPPGSQSCGEYSVSAGKAGPGNDGEGYQAADVNGILLYAASDTTLTDVVINNITSINGDVFGIHVYDKGLSDIKLTNVDIDLMSNIGETIQYRLPNSAPRVCGVLGNDNTIINNLNIGDDLKGDVTCSNPNWFNVHDCVDSVTCRTIEIVLG